MRRILKHLFAKQMWYGHMVTRTRREDHRGSQNLARVWSETDDYSAGSLCAFPSEPGWYPARKNEFRPDVFNIDFLIFCNYPGAFHPEYVRKLGRDEAMAVLIIDRGSAIFLPDP